MALVDVKKTVLFRISQENLPKCDTKKHSGEGQPGISYCTNPGCPHRDKYFCHDCSEMHDHAAIYYSKHITQQNELWQ